MLQPSRDLPDLDYLRRTACVLSKDDFLRSVFIPLAVDNAQSSIPAFSPAVCFAPVGDCDSVVSSAADIDDLEPLQLLDENR